MPLSVPPVILLHRPSTFDTTDFSGSISGTTKVNGYSEPYVIVELRDYLYRTVFMTVVSDVNGNFTFVSLPTSYEFEVRSRDRVTTYRDAVAAPVIPTLSVTLDFSPPSGGGGGPQSYAWAA